ncbi:riboflavin synthase [Acetivibrio cellulolyticus]|uniref:riboflavin synthase n=1 Tax=Acetivibrio cellulolyticus TaxID=35830 RepID=UPI0001E2E311|nr:riboflavin synthase [Acetivibrio cellulolyticus]
MFTGIVEEIGKIRGIVHGSKSIKLAIQCDKIMDDVKLGDSIAVNGICLTVTEKGSDQFTADVMPETMRKTGLENLKVGNSVNLERALRLVDRLGGHIVTGHIDGTGVLVDRAAEDNAIWLTIEANPHILKYIIMKGSVALDGTSLTIAYIDDRCFKVSLIPFTAGVTTLGSKEVGSKINIECDMLGKYIEKLIFNNIPEENSKPNALSLDFLRENGFA